MDSSRSTPTASSSRRWTKAAWTVYRGQIYQKPIAAALRRHGDRITGNATFLGNQVFGGGKSHTLAALCLASRKRRALDVIAEGKALPRPGEAQREVFGGQFFSGVNGKTIPGKKTVAKRMWGWITWSLGSGAG